MPDRAAVFVDQLVDATRNTVVDQLQHLAVRVEIEPQLGLVRQLFMQVFDRRRNIQQQQAARALPHRLLLLAFAVEQADRHAVLFIHQRRVSLHRIAAALLLVNAGSWPKLQTCRLLCSSPSSATADSVSCTFSFSCRRNAARSLPSRSVWFSLPPRGRSSSGDREPDPTANHHVTRSRRSCAAARAPARPAAAIPAR